MAEDHRRDAPVVAQHGSVVHMPQISEVHAGGNISISLGGPSPPAPVPQRWCEEATAAPRSKETLRRCRDELRAFLQSKTRHLFQGAEGLKTSLTPFHSTYAALTLTEGGGGEVNRQHEVAALDGGGGEETRIQLDDMFRPTSSEEPPPRRVLTRGIAGIGKTVAVQKVVHDWAGGAAHRSVHFLFPFTFRDLNLLADRRLSLAELLGRHFDEVKPLRPAELGRCRLLFVLDGLDESELPLDFDNNETCRSVTEAASVDALLTNLIRGHLLHGALVWITSRPGAAGRVPAELVDRQTEIRGFDERQKEEYFLREVGGGPAARTALHHLRCRAPRSLWIMCHVPVFCWVAATVFRSLLAERADAELPDSLTEMYSHFLVVQTRRKHWKYRRRGEDERGLALRLGRLAFEQLRRGSTEFEQSDVEACGLDLEQAAVRSGVCTQVVRLDRGLYQNHVNSFVHLSVQEFLAALYVLEVSMETGQNLLAPEQSLFGGAVDAALACGRGRWDLFLRFLFGLTRSRNREFLQKVFNLQRGRQESQDQATRCLHEKIDQLSSTNDLRSINLFHCLNELGDRTLVEQVQRYRSSGGAGSVSPAHWSALAYVLLASSRDLDVFDLRTFSRSDEVLQRLLPVLRVARTAWLSDCSLTDRCCPSVSSVLSSRGSALEELDLSRNPLRDSGIQLLCDGLTSPNCKLQRLRLNGCMLTGSCCWGLSAALRRCPSLRELDLSDNHLSDPGVALLCAWLKDPSCRLETLRLPWCSDSSCEVLASALASSPSRLRQLELSGGNSGSSALKLLADLQSNKQHILQKVTVTGEQTCGGTSRRPDTPSVCV